MPPTKRELLNQLHSLRHTGLDKIMIAMIAQAAPEKLPIAWLFAIASRETNCLNILGDYRDGEFHGVGVLQIDIQHALARKMRDEGTWRTHAFELIQFGVRLLSANRVAAKKAFPNYEENQWLKVASSGYNCGMRNAVLGAQHGDSDRLTTGKNYGRDVMTRMAMFEELLMEGE